MTTLINSDWRSSNVSLYGGDVDSGPWVLDAADTYVLTEDLTASGMAFLFAASGATLDFNGYTVTYNDTGSCAVTNHDFSADSLGATSITGWTCSGTATVVADTDGPLQYPMEVHFYGTKNLKITVPAAKSGTASLGGSTLSVASTSHGLTTGDYVFLYGFSTTPALSGVYQATVTDSGHFTVDGTFTAASGSGTWSKATYLESADITISEVNCYYTGTIQTADAQGLSASHSSWLQLRQSGSALSLMTASNDQNIALSTWSDYANQTRANTSVAVCPVASTADMRLRLYVGNSSTSGSQDVFIGRATLGKAYTPGILVSGPYEGQLPAYDYLPDAMKTKYRASKTISGYTIRSAIAGGSLVQGDGKGFRSHAIQGNFAFGTQTIQDLTIFVNGDDVIPVLTGHRGTTISNGGVITIGGTGHGLDVLFDAVNVTRRFNTHTALWVKAALKDVTISHNTVTDFPQTAVQASTTSNNTSTLVIDSNTVYGKSIVTNAYAIYCASNNLVTNNVVDGLTRTGASCQGIYAGASANQTLNAVTIQGNTVQHTARGNREERTTSPVRALRIRNQDGGINSTANAVLSNILVDANTFEAFTTTGRPTRAEGIRLSIIQRNGSSGSNIVISGNTCRGISGDASLTACGANLDGIETGVGITFNGNTYDSNHVSLWLTSSDSPGLGVASVDMVDETWTKNTTYSGAASMTYQGIHGGDTNNGGISSFRIISPGIGSGASLAPTYQGSASKTIDVYYRVSTTVTTSANGAPIEGAAFTLLNASAAEDGSGTTNVHGVVNGLLAKITRYSGTTSATTTSYSPHSYALTASGYDEMSGDLGTISADQDLALEMSGPATPDYRPVPKSPHVFPPGPGPGYRFASTHPAPPVIRITPRRRRI